MNKLVGLQWARALAAISVVVTHAIVHPLPAAPGVFHLLARFGVVLFFVISGYIMVITTGQDRFDPVDFIKKRLLRVAPLYYVATGVAVAAVLIVPWAFKDTVFDVPHILLSMLFIPMAEPGPSGAITPFFKLGWTLNYEMFFYAVFALLFAFGARLRAVLLTVILGGLILVGLMHEFAWAPLQFYTRIATLGFIAGVWIAVLTHLDRKPLSGTKATAILAVAAVLFAGLAFAYGWIKESPLSEPWLVAVCALVVVALARAPEAWILRTPRALAYLGDASYSIYLFHMFVVGLAYTIGRRILPDGWEPLIAAGAAVGGVLIGVLIYQFVERPITLALRPLTHSGKAASKIPGAKNRVAT
jgi:exopolysaccharide production protein ExoZ